MLKQNNYLLSLLSPFRHEPISLLFLWGATLVVLVDENITLFKFTGDWLHSVMMMTRFDTDGTIIPCKVLFVMYPQVYLRVQRSLGFEAALCHGCVQ